MNFRIIWKSLAASVFLATLTLACTAGLPKKSVQTAQAKNSNPNIIYGDLVEISSEYLIIPVEVAGDVGFLDSEYSSKDRSKYTSTVNLIFHSLKTGQSHLLLNKKAVITQ